MKRKGVVAPACTDPAEVDLKGHFVARTRNRELGRSVSEAWLGGEVLRDDIEHLTGELADSDFVGLEFGDQEGGSSLDQMRGV